MLGCIKEVKDHRLCTKCKRNFNIKGQSNLVNPTVSKDGCNRFMYKDKNE